ncbi:hypothetical protein HMPREF9057_01058 [Actinomyces sp. oral taxon 171 str. F0337]|nr:hypothetical protein HMPREF9057_01058 [Actinomyces sp. oral taxon 171 str. F0337]
MNMAGCGPGSRRGLLMAPTSPVEQRIVGRKTRTEPYGISTEHG